MARYLSTQYPNKISTNQCDGNKGKRSGKKGDDPKSEDKYSNTTDTIGAHVRDTKLAEESIGPSTPSGGASISAHVLEANENLSR